MGADMQKRPGHGQKRPDNLQPAPNKSNKLFSLENLSNFGGNNNIGNI